MAWQLVQAWWKFFGTHGLVDKPLDSPGIPSRAVWNVQVDNVIIAHFQPTEHVVHLEVSFEPMPCSNISWGRPTTQQTTPSLILGACHGGSQFLNRKQASKALDPANRALEDLGNTSARSFGAETTNSTNGGINFVALEPGDVDLKSSGRILGQSNFVRG